MKNLILKTEEGDLFRFTDSEERTELTIGSRRTADIVVKSQYVEPVQVRLLLKNNIWYAEDMTPENARSVVLLDGRRFKRPMVKFDGVLSIRRAGKKEKADIVKGLEGKKYKVDRSKGLGENEPDMMWLTTMNPETRRLIRVMPEDAERTAQVFDLLLGDNLQGRKDHIAENGYKYLELADIS